MKILITTMMALVILLSGCSTTKPITQDYVSGYDFTTARLVDLPWEMGAAIVGNNTSFEYLDYVKLNHPDWNCLQYMLGRRLFEEHTDKNYNVDDPVSIVPVYNSVHPKCRLMQGELWREPQVVDGDAVLSTNRWFVLSVKALEYGDFNRDGYMDVLIHRKLPGSAQPWEELVLSRRASEDRFYVVEHRNRGCRGMDLDTGVVSEETHPTMYEPVQLPEGCIEHLVYPGETIRDVALMFGTAEKDIRSANNMTVEEKVQAGQVLIVPVL
ncbi:LysM peptidoglycan-binding domain-containing protein [Pontiellaceae bacterium B12227]|nr:LysM peptidoglycan-binding domain-containing protein [Pontiellaceae bacterium B12227]